MSIVLSVWALGSAGCSAGESSSGASEFRDGPPPNTISRPLVAGRHTIVGEVSVRLGSKHLFPRYSTQGDWLLRQTQLALGDELADLPTNPAGCPKIGLFPEKDSFLFPVQEHELAVDLVAAGLACADEFVIAAHAEVESGSEQEGAWAKEWSFPGCRSPAQYFIVERSELRDLVLWNKLGSVEEVTHSEVGPDGIIVGEVGFEAAQHGGGFRPASPRPDPNTPTNYIAFEGLELGPRGAIEFWYLPDWDSPAVGHVVDILYYGVPEDPNNAHIIQAFNDRQNNFVTSVDDPYDPEVQGRPTVFMHQPTPIPGWSTSEPIHLAFAWNGCAPVIADRLRVFVNGQELPTAKQNNYDPSLDQWVANAVLRLGSRLVSGDYFNHPWQGLDGVMDNIKIWNYPKTDFSDRFSE